MRAIARIMSLRQCSGTRTSRGHGNCSCSPRAPTLRWKRSVIRCPGEAERAICRVWARGCCFLAAQIAREMEFRAAAEHVVDIDQARAYARPDELVCMDSPLERAGFEPSVPGESDFGFAPEGPNVGIQLSPSIHSRPRACTIVPGLYRFSIPASPAADGKRSARTAPAALTLCDCESFKRPTHVRSYLCGPVHRARLFRSADGPKTSSLRRGGGAMNSGPTGSVTDSCRIRSISAFPAGSKDQPKTSSIGSNWPG